MKKQITKVLLTLCVVCAMISTNVLAQFTTVLPNDNSTSGNGRAPMNRYNRERIVFLIKASEMTASGFASGTQVGGIGWTYTGPPGNVATAPLIVYLQNTSDVTNLKSTTWATAITGMTVVSNSTISIANSTTPNIIFSGGSPFTYTGGGVYVAYDWGCYGSTLFASVVSCNSAGLVNGLKSAQVQTGVCPATASTTTASSSFRPETRFSPPPPANDAGVDQVYTLGSMPVVYTTNHIIQASITNGGTNTLTSLNVTLNITGSNIFSDVQTIASLAPFTSTTVSFAGFTPTATGTNTVTVSVPADDVNSNNSQTMTQGINTNLASYKYIAPITGGVGFNVTGAGQFQGVFVSKFKTANAFSNADTVNEVKINFQASTALSRYFRVVIFPDSSTLPGMPSKVASYVTPQQTINNTAQQAFLPISPPIALSGTFYVGVTQDSANTVNFGYSYQSEVPVRSSNFFYGAFANGGMTTAGWTDFNPAAPFRSAIEVQYYIPVPPNCAINQSPVNGGTSCKNGAILSWASGGGGPTGYDVYFSTVQSDVNSQLPAALVSANQVATTYSTGVMVGGTTYYWKAVPKNADGTATGCSTFSFTANLGSCYCGSTSTDGTFEYISNVATGAYSHASTSGLYQDQTATGVANNVQLNSFFDVFVTITNPYDEDYIYVFVDWNQDGDFNDAGELAGEADPSGGVGTGTSVEQVTLTVPAGALAGNTVMRIKMGDEVDPTQLDNNPCQTYTYGEVEDYVINVLPCGAGASSNDPVCTNSTINLSSVHYGTGAVNTYSWTGPNGFTSSSPSPSISNVTSANAGTYTVTMTDANTCTSSSSTIVNVPAAPAPFITSNAPACSGTTLTLFGSNSASGQSTGNTFNWTGPNGFSATNNPNPTVSGATSVNAGDYYVTVTNLFSCTASASYNVVINPNPVLSIASQTNVTCNGDNDGQVDVDANNGTPSYLYDLDNGNITLDGVYSGLTPGAHTADVTDDNGCVAPTLVVTITEPDALVAGSGSNTPVCTGTSLNFNSSATGGTTNYGYTWTGPNSFSSGVQSPNISSVTTAADGQYNVQVTDANGCTATSSTTVIIISAPSATASLSGNSNKCLGQSATVHLVFNGVGPWNYTVSDGSQTVSGTTSTNPFDVNITPTSTGTHTYTVTAISDANCGSGGTSSGSATVVVSSSPPSTTAGQPVSPSIYACSGNVYSISTNAIGGQNIRYSWNTGTNSSVVLFSTSAGGPFSPGPFQTTTNQVYAQFGALGTSSGYDICVQGVNGCGSTNNRCLAIRGIVGVPGNITPANGVVACANDVKSYSCGISGGATQYNWTLAGSGSAITGGQGTQNVTVTFPGVFTSGQLCVTAQLPCGGSSISAPRCMTISNNPALPAAMTGPSSVCPGATGVSFSVPTVTGASGYNWTTPVGTTITSGQNTPAITVNFPNPYTGAPPVCVSATSACGSSVARCKTVGSNLPGQPGAITGPTTNICNSTVQYSISNVAGATSFTWTPPTGTTITLGQTTTTIQLSVSPTFTSGQLTVVANTTACTPGSSIPRTITIIGKPNTPGTITANPLSICNGGPVNFSIASVTPQPTDNWTVSNGSITNGQGSNNIDVTWGTGTGTVNVSATNGCGVSGVRSQSFTGTGCREEGNELADSRQQFAVYPNPAHDKVTVSIYVKDATPFSIKLSDISGRVIVSEDRAGEAGLNVYDMNLTNFAKGIYSLEVQSAGDNWKSKVVVE